MNTTNANPKTLEFAVEIALADRFWKPNGSSMKNIIIATKFVFHYFPSQNRKNH